MPPPPPPPPPFRPAPPFAYEPPPPRTLSFWAGFGLGLLAATVVGCIYIGFFVWLVLTLPQGLQILVTIFIIAAISAIVPLLMIAALVSSIMTGVLVKLIPVRQSWLAFVIGLVMMIATVQTGQLVAGNPMHDMPSAPPAVDQPADSPKTLAP